MHILSFDIEDRFHIFDESYYGKVEKWKTFPSHLEDNTRRICDFLEKYQLKSTFFWLGWEAERYPALIRKLTEKGHEIAAHSFFHYKINDLNRESFEKDTEKVIKTLEDLSGKKVNTYRAPGMSIHKNTFWALDILFKLGIEYDSSVLAKRKNSLPDTPFILRHNNTEMKEFPVPVVSVFGKRYNYSGSGYFRLAPFGWIKKKMDSRDYTVSYFHPRDFDPDVHKNISYSPGQKIRYRIGVNRCMEKLAKLTQKHDFVKMSEAAEKTDWDKVPVIEV